ncbi:MAG: lipid A biosynthesis acyltransferase [Gammaproteobacteria bacterium]|nr:lipid A biosynthesis acyltransferase [Gammaproteobacteria bacterium]
MTEKRKPLFMFLSPTHWGEWLLVGLMRFFCVFPFRWQIALSQPVGWMLKHTMRRRRRIAEKNIALCFPEQDARQRKSLLDRHFRSLGMSIFEIGLAWWASDRRLAKISKRDGLENLQNTLNEGKGVILFSAHFTTVELAPRLISLDSPVGGLYRHLSLPLFDEMMYRGRSRFSGQQIDKMNIRQLIRNLRQGHTVYFLPDQAHAGSNSTDSAFFGVKAPTNTTLSRLLTATGAVCLPCLVLRERNDAGEYHYRVQYFAPLTEFPEDPQEAANLLNKIIENWVRQAPEQYFWIHRRFKSHPGLYE